MTLDTVRRVLAVTMLAFAVVGLMPMLPLVFGFYSATVTNNSAGTYYPTTTATSFITCTQDPASLTLQKSQSYSGNYFRCTNNWGSSITLVWTVAQANGTNLSASGSATVAAGAQSVCVPVTLTAGNAPKSNRTVVYQGTVDQADLYAEVEFNGTITIQNGASTPSQCA